MLNGLTRFPMFGRLKVGSAFRYSRSIAGILTGFVFSIGELFKVPIHGIIATGFVGGIGLSAWVMSIKQNFVMNTTISTLQGYKSSKFLHTSAFISQVLKKQAGKDCIATHTAQNTEEDKKEIVIDISSTTFEETLLTTLNENFALLNNREFALRKYLHSTILLLSQIGSHYGECLLLKSYGNNEFFNLDSFEADNILLIAITALALLNGYYSFMESKINYDKHAADEICERLIKAYR